MSIPNSYNSSTQAISGNVSRPSAAGGTAAAFTVADNTNSAMRQIQGNGGLLPRGTVDAPFVRLGSPQQFPSSKRARLMTGVDSTKQGSVARTNTGMGGMSNAAYQAIERFMPNGVPANQFQMAGMNELRFGQHAGNELGVPSFAGFGAASQHPGITMFRTGGVGPQSRTSDGLMFSGLGARPTERDSQRAIHGVPCGHSEGSPSRPVQ